MVMTWWWCRAAGAEPSNSTDHMDQCHTRFFILKNSYKSCPKLQHCPGAPSSVSTRAAALHQPFAARNTQTNDPPLPQPQHTIFSNMINISHSLGLTSLPWLPPKSFPFFPPCKCTAFYPRTCKTSFPVASSDLTSHVPLCIVLSIDITKPTHPHSPLHHGVGIPSSGLNTTHFIRRCRKSRGGGRKLSTSPHIHGPASQDFTAWQVPKQFPMVAVYTWCFCGIQHLLGRTAIARGGRRRS